MVDLRLQEVAKIVSEEDTAVGHDAEARAPSSFTNSFGMKFVRIPAGTFIMGSPAAEPDRVANERQHKVTLTHSFYMATTLVTEGDWKAVVDGDRSELETARIPVSSMNVARCMQFINKLNDTEGRHYRLPTEAEWEYACRAGSTNAYGPGNIADYAWSVENSGNHLHPVAQKKPNAWGLFDIRGDIWEMCSDCYAEYPTGPAVDPTGPSRTDDKMQRVVRGGSWYEPSYKCRAGFRGQRDPTYGDDRSGLRICLE